LARNVFQRALGAVGASTRGLSKIEYLTTRGRASEWVTPPESPLQPAADHIRLTKRPQRLFVDRRGTDVRDYDPASGFKDAKAFDDRSFATGIRSDVVDSEARDNEI